MNLERSAQAPQSDVKARQFVISHVVSSTGVTCHRRYHIFLLSSSSSSGIALHALPFCFTSSQTFVVGHTSAPPPTQHPVGTKPPGNTFGLETRVDRIALFSLHLRSCPETCELSDKRGGNASQEKGEEQQATLRHTVTEVFPF